MTVSHSGQMLLRESGGGNFYLFIYVCLTVQSVAPASNFNATDIIVTQPTRACRLTKQAQSQLISHLMQLFWPVI
jgi:hypothetical protein